MGCAAEMSENIRKTAPYSRKQWRCLIAWINAFLDCGRNNGCGDYPPIPDVPNPCMWVAKQVHEILAHIHPEIMGEVPALWDRTWLDRVVQSLKAGWPNCQAELNYTALFEREIIPTIVPWVATLVSGSCSNYPVIQWEPKNVTEFITVSPVPADVFSRRAYPNAKYVEWRQTSQYSAAGLTNYYGQVTGPLLPGFQSNITDVSEWFSFTQQKMVVFADLCEDDFHFTHEEFMAKTPATRYPQSIQAQNAVILAALESFQAEPSQEAYTAYTDMSPWAVHYDPVSLVSPYQRERGSWGLAPGAMDPPPINSGAPIEVAVRVPKTFRLPCLADCPQCAGNGCEKTLAEPARYLWALRYKHLLHQDAQRQWSNPADSPWLPNTGLARGEQIIWSTGSTLLRQHGVFVSQWNFSGQELRTDFGSNINLWFATDVTHRPTYSPCTGLLGAAGSAVPQRTQIGVIYPSSTFSPPECADAWHY